MNGKDPLKVVATDEKAPAASKKTSSSSREVSRAKFDRLWLQEPERFDITKTARERIRVKRTLKLLKDTVSPADKKVADIGCGSGFISRKLRDEGAIVDAIDISQNALKILQENNYERIHPIQDYMPNTKLQDGGYDIVVATEIIAYLEADQYRIFFSELARIVSTEGYVICSTPIDIQSENALQRFAELAATEFDHFHWIFSYHYLQIKLLDFFKAPYRFAKAGQNKLYREKSINKRFSINKLWFKINSSKLLCYLWKLITPLTNPLFNLLKDNETLLLNLEKLTKLFWNDSAVSHAVFIAKRRPIIPPTQKDFQPQELKHKKQVWE